MTPDITTPGEPVKVFVSGVTGLTTAYAIAQADTFNVNTVFALTVDTTTANQTPTPGATDIAITGTTGVAKFVSTIPGVTADYVSLIGAATANSIIESAYATATGEFSVKNTPLDGTGNHDTGVTFN